MGTFSLDAIHPEDRAHVGRLWADLVEKPGRTATFRYRTRADDGSWEWFEASAANLRDDPTVHAVVINRRDITAEVENQRILEDQVAVRTRELQSLYRADETLRRSLQLDDVLQALVDVACDVLGADKSAVLVRGASIPGLALRASRGLTPALLPRLSTVLERDVADQVFRSGLPVSASTRGERNGTSPELLEQLGRAGVCDLLGVPVVSGGQVFAIFNVLYTTPHDFHQAERRPLVALAERAGLAIENARLYETARAKAVLEERQKLARELHDSVSQALYAIGLNTTAAQVILDADPARVRGLLGDILRLTETGLAEMRSLIFELRPESLETEGLVGALEKQAAAFQARHRLAIETTLGAEPDVALPTKEAVYRIAQEALHNTAKHARAHAVNLALELGDAELVLRIGDDGRGFDASAAYPGHLGLVSMQERAAAAGGKLDIQSAPGVGTLVCLRIPLDEQALAAANGVGRSALETRALV
jgi:signal transduction histidine kinase